MQKQTSLMMVITNFAAKFFTLEDSSIKRVGEFSLTPEDKQKKKESAVIGGKLPEVMEKEVMNLLNLSPRVKEAYLFSSPNIINSVKNMLPKGLVNKIKKEFTGEFLNSKPEVLAQEIKSTQTQGAKIQAKERVDEMKSFQDVNTFGVFSSGGVR